MPRLLRREAGAEEEEAQEEEEEDTGVGAAGAGDAATWLRSRLQRYLWPAVFIGGLLVVVIVLVVPFVLVTQASDEAFVFDGHNDLAWALRQSGDSDLLRVDLAADQSARLMTDLRRLRAGRVGAQFWSVYVPCGADLAALAEQVDLVHRLVARYPDALRFAWSADDVLAARQEGKLASLLGMEGAGPLNGSLAALRLLPRLGVRYMTLTHACSNAWAASCADSRGPPSGLSAEGAAAVAAMNAVGLLVDISHVSADAMRAVLRVTRAPVIFSHSNAFAVCNNSRNVPDDVLAALPANGGVLLVTFVPAFLSQRLLDAQRAAAPPAEQAALLATVGVADVVAHIEHVARVAGRAHVGFGADLDGFDGPAPALASVAAYPAVVDALAQRGWRADELAALMSGNVLRVMRAAEAVAAELTGN